MSLRRISHFIFLAFMGTACLASNINLTASNLIVSFYGSYIAGSLTDDQSMSATNPIIMKYFTPDTINVLKLVDAQTAGKADIGCIDSDLIFHAQEIPNGFKVYDLNLGSQASKATAKVDLFWDAQTTTVNVALLNTTAGWKIDDIRYADKTTLRTTLAACVKNQVEQTK